MSCPRCQADPHPAPFESPRRCAFTEAGEFSPDNWNCATIDALLFQASHEIDGTDESMQITYANGSQDYGGFIVLTRYKHRGCTSSAVHVGDFWPTVPLTLDRALKAIGDIPEESDGER